MNSLTASASQMPYTHLEAVTPSDTVALTGGMCRALYIGVAGDVTVLAEDDTTAVLLKACPVGLIAIRAKRVNATGTAATNIVALS